VINMLYQALVNIQSTISIRLLAIKITYKHHDNEIKFVQVDRDDGRERVAETSTTAIELRVLQSMRL